ncbi:MAG: hypothetical protein AAF282_23225 [Cyanobacteria bacterium P01_A01_bin.15]
MQLQNCLQITLIAGALVASTVQLAGAELPDLPTIEGPTPTPSDNNEPTASPPAGSTEPTQALALTEADVVTLLLENNRELRNAGPIHAPMGAPIQHVYLGGSIHYLKKLTF